MYLDLNAVKSLSMSTAFLHMRGGCGREVGVTSMLDHGDLEENLLFLYVDFLFMFLLVEFVELDFIIQCLHASLILLQNVLQ